MFLSFLTFLLPPGLLLVPRIFLEIVRMGMRYKLKLKGQIEAASCRFSFEQYGRLLIEVDRISIDNPEGFDDAKFATVGKVNVTVSPWGIFWRFFTVDDIRVSDVEVWIQQKKGVGINADELRKKMSEGKKPDSEVAVVAKSEEEKEEDDPDLVLSMLGLLSVDNAAMAADQAMHLIDAAGGMISDKKKEFSENVKEAGGLHNLLVSGIGQLGSALKDAGKKAGETIREGGVGEAAYGAAKAVKQEIGTKVTVAADKAESSLLQSMLHRKLVGCYKEGNKFTKRVAVEAFIIKNIRLHSSGLLSEKTIRERPGLGEINVDTVMLGHDDLVPHPKAKHQDCLPVDEFLRRIKVMMSYQIRMQNRSTIVAFASAGVKERVVPNWLVYKQNQAPSEYVQGVATGAAETAEVTVKRAPKALTKAGSVMKEICGKAADSESVKKIEGGQELLSGAGELAQNTGELAGEIVSKTTEVSEKVAKEAGNLFASVVSEAGGLFGKAKEKRNETMGKAKGLFAKAKGNLKSKIGGSSPEKSAEQAVAGVGGGGGGGADGLEEEGVLVEAPKDKDA